MTDNKICNYPKSSCACYRCTEDSYRIPKGVPTNMSVQGCIFSDYYDCFRTRVFKNQIEPQIKHGIDYINPSVMSSDKMDPTFQTINSKDCPTSSCPGTSYLNSDPRLFNAAAGTWLQLDRPPLNSSIKLNTLNNTQNLNCYGQNYRTYSDVDAGQILYYTSKDREDAFYEPLFSSKAHSIGVVYQDPMTNIKPMYVRVPVDERENPMTNKETYGNDCLSWMKDSQDHRQDLLARQMAVRNQQRWSPRWTNVGL